MFVFAKVVKINIYKFFIDHFLSPGQNYHYLFALLYKVKYLNKYIQIYLIIHTYLTVIRATHIPVTYAKTYMKLPKEGTIPRGGTPQTLPQAWLAKGHQVP